MHWPARGSGRSYNSDAGASYVIGLFSHRCVKNFAKSRPSKEMEPKAALLITEEIAKDGNGIFLANIIMDDDTTTMSQLKNRSKGGLL
mmetsp:Transcript_39552/g.57760  ORF Transcript_39552/g.57760 Transcript_39552/m.57760 type:complete len:88 (+) Transcript_39552:737-1000(+)